MSDWINRTPPSNDIPNSYDWGNLGQTEKSNVYVIVVFFVAAFLLRKTKWGGVIWNASVMVVFSLFIALFVDQLKNGVKKWWDS